MAEPQAHRPYSMLRLLSLLHGVVAPSRVILIGLGIGIKYGEAALTRVLGPASEYRLHISHLYLALGCLAVPLALVGWKPLGENETQQPPAMTSRMRSFEPEKPYLVTVAVILVVEITVASVVLAFFPLVRDLEHDIVTLRRSYRGYNETGDFSAPVELGHGEGGLKTPGPSKLQVPQGVFGALLRFLPCGDGSESASFVRLNPSPPSGQRHLFMVPPFGFAYKVVHVRVGCCKSLGTAACDGHNVSPSVIHQEGCFRRLLKITKTQSYTLSWVSLGTAAMQLPGALATLLLFIKLG
ncbi:Tetraspanin-16 [Fukomys damarensis]|uniref:Tetraspanin-16 n=1 Tax=Fukomys damarensis TaxID=885580 RepID=A0A091E140_FUKDA|nr:Tetraspanin-16 [Fukomys damarensis]